MVVPCRHPVDADLRHGDGDGDLTRRDFARALAPTTTLSAPPTLTQSPPKENKHERIRDFPCIPQP